MKQTLAQLARWRMITLGFIAAMLVITAVQNVRGYMALRNDETARVLDDFSMTLAAPAARRQTDSPALATIHPLGDAASPHTADQLPMRAYPAAAAIMLALCFLRLGRRNQWAYAALGGAFIAMVLSALTWAHYGFPVGQWIAPIASMMDWLIANPIFNSLVAMLFLLAALLLILPPYARPKPAHQPKRTRPDSPNDPRLALEYLGAQRTEGACTAIEYARRRDAILARI